MTDRGIAVVGCGKQGEKHLRALAKLAAPIWCTDVDKKLEKCVANRLDAQPATIETILADPMVGGLVISTPTQTHFALMEQALKQGKHVFCEKPLTATLAEARALERIETETSCYVMSGFIYRFVPAFERLRELTIENVLGSPSHVLLRIGGRGEHRIWKHQNAQGGGVVNEMLVHMLDLALWLFGPLHDPQVLASDLLMPQRLIEGEEVQVDADDFVLVSARTETGAPITFAADMVTPAFTQFLDAQYDNASVMASIQPGIADQLFLKEARGGLPEGAQSLAEGRADLYHRQMAAFTHVVETATPPDRNRVSDSVEIMRLMTTIQEQVGKNAE